MAFVAFSMVLLLVTGWVSLRLFAHMHQFVYHRHQKSAYNTVKLAANETRLKG